MPHQPVAGQSTIEDRDGSAAASLLGRGNRRSPERNPAPGGLLLCRSALLMEPTAMKSLPSPDASVEVSRPVSTTVPRSHHLDRRASLLAELSTGAPDDLLSTRAVAEWLGVSVQFLEIGRHKGYGPKFVRIGPARIRYRRSDVLTWLEERTFASTSQYGEVA